MILVSGHKAKRHLIIKTVHIFWKKQTLGALTLKHPLHKKHLFIKIVDFELSLKDSRSGHYLAKNFQLELAWGLQVPE